MQGRSTEEVDMGSDHRAVEVILELTMQKKRSKRRKRTKAVAWERVKHDEFRAKTDELVQSTEFSQDV